MAVVNTEPKFSKRKRRGKNKKKAWRAVNVDDIEEFLEDERRQIRTGGIVSEKSDDSLFVVDTGKTKQEISSKKKRKDKPLKCLALLEPNAFTKPVRTPDQDGFQQGKRKQRVLERLRERSQSAVRVTAQAQREQATQKRSEERAKKRKLPQIDGDLWADDNDYSGKIKRPKGLNKKPSALSATVVPHPGASVNPSYEHHQKLLQEALTTEEIKEKKAKKIYNALDAMFPSKEQAKMNEALHMKEMAAGLFEDSSDDEEEDEDKEDNNDEEVPESFSVGAPVRREDRKTKKQRRIQKVAKIEIQQKTGVNTLKKREQMALRIPTLKAEIKREEKKKQERAAIKMKKKEQEKFKTKKLNKIKFEEQDLDLKLSSELVASLREVKPEGHVMQDVYKSLQRRNIIEPRVRQKNKRKYRPKVFEKKTHKAVTL